MSKTKIYIYSALLVLCFMAWIATPSSKEKVGISKVVKIALREVGHQLLLQNYDSTSLVLPILKKSEFNYELSFQEELSFEPSQLVSLIKESFAKGNLSNYYSVEVFSCSENNVVYSYQISANAKNTLIPCVGRFLPSQCYTIEVAFTKKGQPFVKVLFLISWILCGFIFVIDFFLFQKKSKKEAIDNRHSVQLGAFQFYPEQNKLVKQAMVIGLSQKECELMSIFVANRNQIVTRNELTKQVWEDKGVFVGRSLDTYISKLRKKLKDDSSLKIVNIHGVGYKLNTE